MMENPLINLSVDGQTAKGRWDGLAFIGDGKGGAWITGGIYENEYVREGRIWKIASVHFYPQYSGSYEKGWTNWGGDELPFIPFHFTVDETGIPVPPAIGAAPRSSATMLALEKRIAALNDEDAARNLQNAYGYYVDRKMWDDVVDLFTDGGVLEIAGVGSFKGKDKIRRALLRMGSAGLKHGELNDRPIFGLLVTVDPDHDQAFTRGTELAMLGDADKGTASWEVNIFRNRLVKEKGLWKIREMRFFPHMQANYSAGWGKGRLTGPVANIMPAFLGANPVTGKPVRAAAGMKLSGTSALTPAAPAIEIAGSGLAEAQRKLRVSAAFDGAENVSSAYGYYLDDFQWPQLSAIFAEKGNKQSPFAGYYLGRPRIQQAATVSWGNPPTKRTGISFHWRLQPVINVASDGRSANIRTRLFQPRTSKDAMRLGRDDSFTGFHAGMYPNDQVVLENGIWRFWSLTIDEHYFTSVNWKDGWSGAKDRPAGEKPKPSKLLTLYPPDIPMTELGVREEHFKGGTGDVIEWPGILPMWFNYRNPVSGRVPERYWPDCVPCEKLPDARMTGHGYLMPPTGPEASNQALSGNAPSRLDLMVARA